MMITILLAAALAAPSGEGWDNVCPERTLREPVKEYWSAPFSGGADAFVIEKHEGAEGTVEFSGGAMTVRKTNVAGYILIKSRNTFSRPVGTKLRSYADSEVSGADPNYSLGFARVLDSRMRLHACFKFDAQAVFMGGGEKMAYLANTAPGVAERRFSGFEVVEAGGCELTPALVIAGAPSHTRWVRWGVEDYGAAEGAWQKIRSRMVSDGSGKRNLEDEKEFDRRLAADRDHTARVEKTGGLVRLKVDSRDVPPVMYKNPGSWGLPWGDFNGRAMAREGVRLQAVGVGGERHWTNGEWNVAATVRDLKDMMRVSPDALTVVSFSCSAPREYAEKNPGEIWRHPDGTPCVGTWGKMRSRHFSDPNKKPYADGCWPWISHSSVKYTEYLKGVLARLIGELRRTGLSKRIVGIHFCGWHDGQFAPYRADYSEPVKAGFRKFLVERYGSAPEPLELPVPSVTERFFDQNTERGRFERDFNLYLHLAPFRMQEELAREAKKLFAKDVVCMHWCMGVYGAQMNCAFYFDEFFKSDSMDVMVAQPSYVRRKPGNSVGNLLPLASFGKHGKLYVDELDLRAWGEIPGYVKEPSLGGLGFAMDLPEWQAINRKMTGRMIAAGHGYWYYDISGGFYNPDPVENEIGEALKVMDRLRRGGRSSWRPSAAFVVDSEGMLWRNMIGVNKHPNGMALVNTQLEMLAGSSVPFEIWSYADVAADGARALAPCKTVVMAGFHEMDAGRKKFLSSLLSAGKTVVLLSGTGGFSSKVRKVGSDHDVVAEDPSRELEFISRHHTDWTRWLLGVRGGPLAMESLAISFAFDERPGTEVLARYRSDRLPAVIRRGNVIAFGESGGLTGRFFNRLVRESGGYVPVEGGLQVDMSGDFVSVSALDTGRYDFRLPFPCKVENLKTSAPVETEGGVMKLDLVAGETRWYRLEAAVSD